MENSCRKKYRMSSKNWVLASRHTGFRRNSALIPANAGLFHYAGNNPVRYIDPDGNVLINTVTNDSYSAAEYEKNHNLDTLAFGQKILDKNGIPTIPLSGSKIEFENGLNKALKKAYQYKNNPNVTVAIKAFAEKTDKGNYKIGISVSVDYIDKDSNSIINIAETSGVIAFANSTEVGDFGFGCSQENINNLANSIINRVLGFPDDTSLIEDK